MRGLIWPALGILAALLAVGCGEDDDNGTTGRQFTAQQHVDFGWEFFEAGDYEAALRDFELATGKNANLADAWNGGGWSLGKLEGRLDDAPARFATALQLDTARYDALGGWAFAAFQLGDWPGALRKSDSLLHRRPGWRFLHEQTLDELDLRLLQASAHFNMSMFDESYNVVRTYLNPSFEADISTSTGRRELLEEIERLRRING